MRKSFTLVAIAVLAGCSGSGGAPASPDPTPAPSTTPSPGRTATPTPVPAGSPSAVPLPSSPATGPATAKPTGTPSAKPTATPSAMPTVAAARATIGSCTVFPADNAWNTNVASYPVDANSGNYLTEMNPSGGALLHPDFGSDPSYGIPINIDTIASGNFTPIAFTQYASESDPGPYPIPTNAAIEAGSDRHMLIVDQTNCELYETWLTQFSGGAWSAANGAVFNLNSDALRPEGWTSADAAGLPIAAGLVRYAEVQAGAVNHAIRFTMSTTFAGHIHPATHDAGGNVPNSPPMGLRIRLKGTFDLSTFHGESLVILTALKKYGAILADNGSNFYLSGETNTNWNDNDLNQLKTVPASAFEVVHTGPTIASSFGKSSR